MTCFISFKKRLKKPPHFYHPYKRTNQVRRAILAYFTMTTKCLNFDLNHSNFFSIFYTINMIN
ncbi:hypothetical protein FXB78_04855 [Aggregatibacter actinomycetemcomitans]|nr:hypothetical protein FXN58_08080 [Aggregatibacter actinomycetemcomitans]QEH47759.1 hypothetical protein FXN59_09485 [Aggregatibacter actinomycetemcomitans]QEH49558.1 hypothetical protein FXN57_07935 [Aggregatibacter actinomycetemcomitans]TYA48820.1 hypothetical protein FXB74_07885 [Aggregatibacter actinomycetemcomitans]TYA51632.1 hypothetical protein FXB81_02580 [Aggregatibacter actinomycetemcomitans]